MATDILVNIDSGYGLLPDGTRPLLPGPMMTPHHSFGIHLRANLRAAILYNESKENYIFEITAAPPRGQWVKAINTNSLLQIQCEKLLSKLPALSFITILHNKHNQVIYRLLICSIIELIHWAFVLDTPLCV